jgi:hypothetical protein
MSEIPAVPAWTRDALSAKFGPGTEYGAALWAWGVGWSDCRKAIYAALDAASVPASAASRDRAGRLELIAERHRMESEVFGSSGGFCIVCGDPWPCETRRLADGTDPSAAGSPS